MSIEWSRWLKSLLPKVEDASANKYKNVTDFLIVEYEKIAQAHFNAQEILSRWVRFYFLVVAAPFAIGAFLSREGNKEQPVSLLPLPGRSSAILILVGVVGVFISLIIFDIRLDTALYARSVNGIRRYFLDQDRLDRSKLDNDSRLDPSSYIVLPTDVSKPSLTKLSVNGWIFVLMFALINGLYVGFGSWSLFPADQWGPCTTMLTIIIWALVVAVHPFFYKRIGTHKESKYVTPPQR